MTDPVKEAVERLTENLERGWINNFSARQAVQVVLASHSRLEAENAQLTKLVEEAGEALAPLAKIARHAERDYPNSRDERQYAMGFTFGQLRRAALTHKAIKGGGE